MYSSSSSALVPFGGGVGSSGTGPPFFAVECLVRVESCSLEVGVQRVEPSLLWSALRSFSGDVDVEASLCKRVVIGAQRVAIPSEAGFSHLLYDGRDAVPVSDVVVADVVEAGDSADPSQHLRPHDGEAAFSSFRDWPAFGSV